MDENTGKKKTRKTKEEVYAEAKIKRRQIAEEQFKDKIEGYDYLVCQICGLKSEDLNGHMRSHNITPKEYKEKFNVESMKCQRFRDKVKGENNPGYNHGGKFSAWSKNFIHGYDEEKHEKFKEHHSEFMKNYDGSIFNYEYWLKEANGDEELAKKLHTKSQTRDLAWFIKKFGPDEGPIRHKAKTEKWIKSFKKCNYSLVSQELFDELAKHIDCTHVYYATYDRPEMEDYKNKEFILKLETTFIRPDFVDINSKKIIEFDGVYWHSRLDEDHEEKRDDAIMKAGYTVMHVAEEDFYLRKSQIIKECLAFLKE